LIGELCVLLYFANEDIDIRNGKHPFFVIFLGGYI
jgi:hypothetical protein